MKVLTGCSGVGAGFELSAIANGLILKQFIEMDDDCRSILSLRYPGVPIHRYMQSFTPYQGQYDVCLFSPPCQPFSLGGMKNGRADPRDMFPEVLRIIYYGLPKYFAIENVPGLLSCPFLPGMRSASYWAILAGALSEVGYNLEVLRCSSAAFGSPWIRERVLVVGISRRLIFTAGKTEAWIDQARREVKTTEDLVEPRGIKSPITRSRIRAAIGVDEPVGVPSGDRVVRARRASLGNCLDTRVASLAIARILYHRRREVTQSVS